MELHSEHPRQKRCRLKLMMSNLGSNISPKSVQRIAKSLGVVHEICTHFKKLVLIRDVTHTHLLEGILKLS